jgi:hypothetical protein
LETAVNIDLPEDKLTKSSVEENFEKRQKVLAWKQEQAALQMKKEVCFLFLNIL